MMAKHLFSFSSSPPGLRVTVEELTAVDDSGDDVFDVYNAAVDAHEEEEEEAE